MITERRFAGGHHAFWDELLPMGEHYIRQINQGLPRFRSPLVTPSEPRYNGIVNELAFRLFARSRSTAMPVAQLSGGEVAEEAARARDFIETFRQHGRGRTPAPGGTEIADAKEMAERIAAFFEQVGGGPLVVRPHFPGCGWLSVCDGDVLSAAVLYELKAGARRFRMLDVKQLLTYCALNFAAKTYDIRDVCLVNPREGTYFSERLGSLCELVAGRAAVEVLSDIVEYVSDASTDYTGA